MATTAPRTCENCGSILYSGSPPSRRFCSDQCRNSAFYAAKRRDEALDWLRELAWLLEEMPSPRSLEELVRAAERD
jgi:hypothetical protein